MKDKKIALYAIAFILIGGLIASPSMQLSGIAFAQDDTDEVDEEEHDDNDDTRDSDYYKDYDSYKDHKEKADEYCNMSDEEREERLAEHTDMREYKEKLDEYCQLDEYERGQYIEDHKEEYRDKYRNKVDYMKDNFESYCEMSNEERDEFHAMHDRMTDEIRVLHDRYCSMTDEEREEFKKENHDTMMDFKEDHKMMINDKRFARDFVRDFDMRIASMCDISDTKMRELMQKHEFLQEHHERIAEYCNMSEDERKEYRMSHNDMMEDYMEDFGQMRDRIMEGQPDMKMKMQEKMRQYNISDEKRDVLQEKFRTMHSDLSDVERDEIRDKIKSKYMDHFKSGMEMRFGAMSDLQKDQILKRHEEMKDFKSELRLKYKDMSEDERIQFQAEFRDKVSDKRFAWISPHKQMLAGIGVDEIECREGLNLVLKTSNGKAMCVKSATAERLIENGIAVPAA